MSELGRNRDSGAQERGEGAEVLVRRINLENEAEAARVRVISDDPASNRHLIPFGDGESEAEYRALEAEIRSGSAVGIYRRKSGGQEELLTIALTYPYEDRDVPQLKTAGLIKGAEIPRTPGGHVDYKKVTEVSLFIPAGPGTEEELGSGLAMVLQRIPGGNLVFYNQLLNVAESAAPDLQTKDEPNYREEIRREKRIIERAGFTLRSVNEKDDVAVFAMTV